MSRMKMAVLILGATIGSPEFALAADEIEIKIPKTVYQPGEKVTATIRAVGDVGIENDIMQQSSSVKVMGETTVELGVIPKPGLYTIRAFIGKGAAVAVLLAYRQGNQFHLSVATDKLKDPPKVPKALIDKFGTNITKARLTAAAKKAVDPWLKANIASLGGTTVYCTVCVVPSGQIACTACVSSIAGNAVDLAIEILRELANGMEKDGVITKDEAKLIRNVLQLGSGAIAILSAGDKVEKALAGLTFAVETLVDNETATVLVSNATDEVSKVRMLIKINKK